MVGTAGYTGSPLQASEMAGTADLAALEEATVTGREGTGRQVEFAAELDLSDSGNLRAALGVLRPDPVRRAGAVVDLDDRFAEDGRLTFQTYDTTASDDSAEVKVGLGVNAGLGGGETSDGQDLAGAFIREPGSNWLPRNCGLS